MTHYFLTQDPVIMQYSIELEASKIIRITFTLVNIKLNKLYFITAWITFTVDNEQEIKV